MADCANVSSLIVLIYNLNNKTDPKKIRVLRAPCMGRCDTSPTVEIGHNHVDFATTEKILSTIDKKVFSLRGNK